MIAQHFPALQVVVPLVAACVCAALRNGALAWAWSTAIAWLCLLFSVALLLQVAGHGSISYAMGDWAPPWGIEYRIDMANAFVLVLVSLTAAIVFPYARASVADEIPAAKHALFYAMMLLCLTGLLGITITGDAFNIFVFLEISSLSTYVLIAMGRDRRALTAAFQYLVMGTIGATFIVIGIGMLYMMTGTLNIADMAQRLPAVITSAPVAAAFVFLTVGLSLKLALFPLHLWLPNAYAYAPSSVTAFLAATATKVAIYVMLRFFYTVFGFEFAFHQMPLPEVMLLLAVIGMGAASIVALFQSDLKRMLAYSSLAQIGLIMIGISFANQTGLTASIVHLFNHALTKGALFLFVGCLAFSLGTVRIEALAGQGRRQPLVMGGFVLAGMSLIGAPLTVGLISKWYLVQAALERGWWWAAVIVLASGLLTLLYFWRVVEIAYFRPAPDDARPPRKVPISMLAPALILLVLAVYFGIDAEWPLGAARQAAAQLMGAAR